MTYIIFIIMTAVLLGPSRGFVELRRPGVGKDSAAHADGSSQGG
jgi:hypothetical protein